MKTKFQTLGCLLAGLALSTAVFAGDPTNSILSNTANTDNTNSILSTSSYHHGSGSGDGAFSGNIIDLGVGFVNVGFNFYGAGGSTSTTPAFEISYEHALGKFGIGLNFAFQSSTTTFTTSGTSYNYVTFVPSNYTNTEKYTTSLLQFVVRGAYHISASDKLDPYIGLQLGYCTASGSYSFSTNDPNSPGDGNTGSAATASLTGVEFGGYLGAKYYFTDHVGAWLEFQYAAASFSSGGYSVSIDPCTMLNLGLAFKF